MLGNHFRSLPNTITNHGCNNVVHSSVNFSQYHNITKFYCDASANGISINKLPCSSAAGLVLNIHFTAGAGLSLILTFFSICVSLIGIYPVTCLRTVISPVIENTNADVSDINKYRPIAVSTIFSKLVEHVILHFISCPTIQ